ncbi:DNA photolyase [candidate division KSB1 bacterium]|nr:DNA photolyase [candidate division KSB1 bacterium]
MPYKLFTPDHIYITSDAIDYPVTKQILSTFHNVKYTCVDDENSIDRSYTVLLLTKQRADFYKNCPGTKKYICCGYQILNLINNCEIGCTYCILQGYLDEPYITVFVNIDDLFQELSVLFNGDKNRYFRIGTGELADSLSTDHFTGYARMLVEFFSDKRNAMLELKTKTTQIDNILNIRHGGRTVVSWSLNTPRMIASEESNAPTLDERLLAAKRCQDAGYRIGLHFDPMIYYPNWEAEYKEVIDRVFEFLEPGHIIWISLGALRYPPYLEDIIRERHPNSKITYGELVTGIDNKMRYVKTIRIEMFRKMYQWLKKKDPNLFIYCCMEHSDVWKRSFGWTPGNSLTLKNMMDELIQ